MLLYRLMALQFLRCLTGPNDSNSTERSDFSRVAGRANGARTIFCPHGEPATGSTLLLTIWVSVLVYRFRRLSTPGQVLQIRSASSRRERVGDVDGICPYHWPSFITGASVAEDAKYVALFIGNFHFASIGTQYFTANQPPSTLQQFWSLACPSMEPGAPPVAEQITHRALLGGADKRAVEDW